MVAMAQTEKSKSDSAMRHGEAPKRIGAFRDGPEAEISPPRLGVLSQFAFQGLNVNASARTTGRQLAVDHDGRNGSNAELLGARANPSVHHIADDDLARRTGLYLSYLNYLMAERASRAEYFHRALTVHGTPRGRRIIWNTVGQSEL
jgi:hypothetical protein